MFCWLHAEPLLPVPCCFVPQLFRLVICASMHVHAHAHYARMQEYANLDKKGFMLATLTADKHSLEYIFLDTVGSMMVSDEG